MSSLKFPKLPHRKDQGNIWIFGDLHAYHKNIADGSSLWEDTKNCRPFSDQYVMTDVIISNINELVKPSDFLIHLGDWSFSGRDKIETTRKQIKCRNVYNILGNHDHHIRNNESVQRLFTWVGDYLEFRYNGWLFVCSHYPLESWNEMGGKTVHCHGHCHGHLNRKMNRRYDLGLENTEYKPVYIENIIGRAKEESSEKVDHH